MKCVFDIKDTGRYLDIRMDYPKLSNQMKKRSITAAEFDEKFEKGEDITSYLKLDKAIKPGLKARRVSVDFPEWMVDDLDREAQKLGITRQCLIKVFISEKLKEVQ